MPTSKVTELLNLLELLEEVEKDKLEADLALTRHINKIRVDIHRVRLQLEATHANQS